MLQRSGQQPVGFHHQHRAIELRQRGFDLRRPPDLRPDALDTQAALDGEFPILAKLQHGIDENQRHERNQIRRLAVDPQVGNTCGVVGNIHHGQSERHRHLWGRQANPMGLDHRLQHVTDQVDEVFINFGDFAATLAEYGVAVLDDIENHGAEPPSYATEVDRSTPQSAKLAGPQSGATTLLSSGGRKDHEQVPFGTRHGPHFLMHHNKVVPPYPIQPEWQA